MSEGKRPDTPSRVRRIAAERAQRYKAMAEAYRERAEAPTVSHEDTRCKAVKWPNGVRCRKGMGKHKEHVSGAFTWTDSDGHTVQLVKELLGGFVVETLTLRVPHQECDWSSLFPDGRPRDSAIKSIKVKPGCPDVPVEMRVAFGKEDLSEGPLPVARNDVVEFRCEKPTELVLEVNSSFSKGMALA